MRSGVKVSSASFLTKREGKQNREAAGRRPEPSQVGKPGEARDHVEKGLARVWAD